MDMEVREQDNVMHGIPLLHEPDCVDSFMRPLKDLRLSVIDQCNFRCNYCMPKDVYTKDFPFLNSASRMSFEEMHMLCRAFVQLGVEKIRITGGEPTLRKDLPRLIESLASLTTASGKNVEIAMTTNGSLLAAQAQSLKDAGLQRVTVSLDSLDDDTFMAMNDVGFPVKKVLTGIDAALRAGLNPVKVNTVVKRGLNENQILPLARHFRGTGVNLRFIEFMDVGGADSWSMEHVIPSAEVKEILEQEFLLIPVNTGRASDTAQNYSYGNGMGSLGFISSVSAPFCGDCTRARISADGKLYLCLFAMNSIDLRSYLNPGKANELEHLIRTNWKRRSDQYSELRVQKRSVRNAKQYRVVRMSLVGG